MGGYLPLGVERGQNSSKAIPFRDILERSRRGRAAALCSFGPRGRRLPCGVASRLSPTRTHLFI